MTVLLPCSSCGATSFASITMLVPTASGHGTGTYYVCTGPVCLGYIYNRIAENMDNAADAHRHRKRSPDAEAIAEHDRRTRRTEAINAGMRLAIDSASAHRLRPPATEVARISYHVRNGDTGWHIDCTCGWHHLVTDPHATSDDLNHIGDHHLIEAHRP